MKEGLRRVVITGYGAVTPLGLNAEDSWEKLKACKSGIKLLPEEMRYQNVKTCAPVDGLDLRNYFDAKEFNRNHRSVLFAAFAAIPALHYAGLLSSDNQLIGTDPERVASMIGSCNGGASHIAEVQKTIMTRGINKILPNAILAIDPSRVNTFLAMKLGILGQTFTISSACATGNVSIIQATEKVMLGQCDVVIAGGTEASINQHSIGGFAAIRALTPYSGENPQEACKPFDEEADGFVLGEGAGVVIVEGLDHAIQRGAEDKIMAEIVGYRHCSDGNRIDAPEDLLELGLKVDHARNSDTEPSIAGALAAMSGALNMAEISPTKIDYVNAHAPGPAIGSKVELLAYERFFGDHRVPISSFKAATGHMIAGAAAEMVFCLLVMRDNIIPPTLNLRRPMRSSLNLVVGEPRTIRVPINYILENHFGFGGVNTSIIIKRYQAT